MNRKIDGDESICFTCARCINNEECLIDFEGAYDHDDNSAGSVDDVTACENYMIIED